MPLTWSDFFFNDVKRVSGGRPSKAEGFENRKESEEWKSRIAGHSNQNKSRFASVYFAKGEKLT